MFSNFIPTIRRIADSINIFLNATIRDPNIWGAITVGTACEFFRVDTDVLTILAASLTVGLFYRAAFIFVRAFRTEFATFCDQVADLFTQPLFAIALAFAAATVVARHHGNFDEAAVFALAAFAGMLSTVVRAALLRLMTEDNAAE